MNVFSQIKSQDPWTPIEVPKNISNGDMPGDKVEIGVQHIAKAELIFSTLIEYYLSIMQKNPYERIVISVFGGSGVGKSEIASLLAYYFRSVNVESYVLSGDNYAHRIPIYNDAERLRIFRSSGILGLISDGKYSSERSRIIRKLQQINEDQDPNLIEKYPWLAVYQKEGRNGLKSYLGTNNEIKFTELCQSISLFKNGINRIFLKRMGRTNKDLWYEEVDFNNIHILIIEWTHGNSDYLHGVDIPIFLNSTPQETLMHRKSRGRDGETDSKFTTMVLDIEQEMLDAQAKKSKIIISKNGKLTSYEKYQLLMNEK